MKQFLGCTRTLDGKTLLTLDRFSAAAYGQDTLPRLGGLEREIIANTRLLVGFRKQLENAIASQRMAFTVVRLRSHAASAYLAAPITTADLPFHEIEHYWHLVSGIETALAWLRSPIYPINAAVDLCRSTIGDVDQTIECGDRIIRSLRQFAQQLGPIAAI